MRKGAVMVEDPLVRPQFGSFPPNRSPYSVLLLLVSHLIFNLTTPRFVICPHLHMSFVYIWLPTSWVILHIFSPFPEPPVPFENTRFFTTYSPQANVNRANVSLALLPILRLVEIPHCLDIGVTVNCEILVTCRSTYSPVRTSQETHSVSIK
jgi:hypothetical protein